MSRAQRQAPGEVTDGDDVAIDVRDLSKSYELYDRPQDRLKQSLWRGRRTFYREVPALRSISFTVRRGETVGIIGRNGSGKSTLLEIIAGTLTPSAGEARVSGRVAALLELGAGFDPAFTGRENVHLNASILGLSREQVEERFDAIAAFADIPGFIDRPVRTYSSGMFVRLAFATAINVEADVLVIDEALAVGDEAFQRKCYARLDELKAEGVTVLFVSHSASTILELCDRALFVDAGERLLYASPRLVVTRYHKLIYASPERRDAVRDEILEFDRAGSAASEAESCEAAPHSHRLHASPTESDAASYFDPELRPETTLHYDCRGARIENVRLLTGAGEPVNVLLRGKMYGVHYDVVFSERAFRVRFGTLISTLTGVELSGLQSHPDGDGLEVVEAGTRVGITFHFRNRFLPGTYFLRVGCTAAVDGEDVFLHRIIDALMFRISPEAALPLVGVIDVSEGLQCEIRPMPQVAS